MSRQCKGSRGGDCGQAEVQEVKRGEVVSGLATGRRHREQGEVGDETQAVDVRAAVDVAR